MYSIAQKHIDEGIEKGILQGIEQNTIRVVNNMLRAKCDLKLITQVTGLSEEDVMKLKANL